MAPTYKHVIEIFEENHAYGQIVGSPSAPYINSVIAACGVATNYHNITHPSLPNYITLTSGALLKQMQPFLSDCVPSSSCQWTGVNLFSKADSVGGWKSYSESMPAPCSKTNSGFYVPRHNPAVYYTNLNDCATRDLALGTTSSSPLLQDFGSEQTAPAFATVTPNLCNDMHGAKSCPAGNLVVAGDNWLKTWLPLITSTAVYQAGQTVVFIVWDEGTSSSATKGEHCARNTADESCHVPAIVVAPSVSAGTQSATLFNHDSLLKTIEDLLGVSELGGSRSATSMISAFNL